MAPRAVHVALLFHPELGLAPPENASGKVTNGTVTVNMLGKLQEI